MSDPRQWVTNPPNTFVKVVNTSRETLNGSYGIVLSYQHDRQRYIVHFGHEQVSLKADHLVVCTFLEKFKAQFQLLSNDPSVQAQIGQFFENIQRRLPPGVKYQHALLGLIVGLLASFYFFGFSRVMMTLSLIGILLIVIYPDLSGGWAAIRRNAPMRWRNLLRQHVPYVGHTIANSTLMTNGLVGLILAMYVATIVRGKASPRLPAPTRPSAHDASYYYKLGFEDATQGLDFGASMAGDGSSKRPLGVDSDTLDDDPFSPLESPMATRGGGLGWGTLFGAAFLGKSLWDLGYNPTSRRFDVPLFMSNIRRLEPWRLGLMALSAFRLIRAVLSNR